VDGVKRILRLDGCSLVGRRLFRGLKSILLPSSIEPLCKSSVRECGSAKFVLFEAGSMLQRIKESASDSSGPKSIAISLSIEVLCESCFSNCQLLSTMTFESNSHLRRIEKSAFGLS
jgi:hypothetical protein